MAPFTPFLSEYFFQNLKNGFDPASPLNIDSIHFTSMPNFDESLIYEKIENSVTKMQDAIVTGRLIRDAIKVPMKWPLRKVVLIDADQEVLDNYIALEKYIKEELNCFEIVTEINENAHVNYSCEPENKLIGQALKKANNKEFGQKLRELTTDELKQYLATGKVMCHGHELQEGWLKIGKDFKPEFKNHERWAVRSSMLSSVMLDKF
jgi:isoleucyl-tRNA synthetase